MLTEADIHSWLSGLDHLLVASGQTGLPAWLPPTAVVMVVALLVLRLLARQLHAWLLGFMLGWLAGTGYWTQLAPWLAALWQGGWSP